MKRISIERYDAAKHDTPDGRWDYSGLIEGETDDGSRWIMWIDRNGAPEVFWPKRDATGAVVGPGIDLKDKDKLGLVYGTKEHPMTYSEWISQPNTGLDSTDGDVNS